MTANQGKPTPGQPSKGDKEAAASSDKSGGKQKENWLLNPPGWDQKKEGKAWETTTTPRRDEAPKTSPAKPGQGKGGSGK